MQEARAKLELREVITTEMALDVVNLMRESMLDTLTDEFGGIDFSRTAGTSKKGVDVGVVWGWVSVDAIVRRWVCGCGCGCGCARKILDFPRLKTGAYACL